MTDDPKWKRFEKLAYDIQKEFAGNATVTLADQIEGIDTKVTRKIDISVRDNVGQYPMLVIIECKDHKEPLDVKTVEEFSGMVRDVRANKGVLISSNGFTRSAINLARNHGIDTFRLIDTESVDWKAYVAVPALIERTFMVGYQMEVVSIGQMVLPYDGGELGDLVISSSEGEVIGSTKTILESRWNNEEIPHQPGRYIQEIGKNVTVTFRGVTSALDVSAFVNVAREFYLGPMPLSMRGLEDAQKGGIITRGFRTGEIDFKEITSGNIAGWSRIEDPSTLSVKVGIRIGITNPHYS